MCVMRSARCSCCTACMDMFQPNLAPFRAAPPVDTLVGFANGMLGGMTGLTGPIVVIWCQLTGVPRHTQRAIFQPVIFAAFVVAIVGLGIGGAVTRDVLSLFALGSGSDRRRNLARCASLRPAG